MVQLWQLLGGLTTIDKGDIIEFDADNRSDLRRKSKREAREGRKETGADYGGSAIWREERSHPSLRKGRAEEVVDIATTSDSIGKCSAHVVGLAAKQAEELGHANWINFAILGKPEIIKKYNEKLREYVQKKGKPDMVCLTYELKKIMVGQNTCPIIVVCGQRFMSIGTSAQLVSDVMSRENRATIRTGYTPPGSAGDVLTRAKTEAIRVLDSPVVVKCEMLYVPLSAHATQGKLVDFICQQKPENVVVVHSEPERVGRFIDALYDNGYEGHIVYAENFRVILRNGILGLK
jgi:predicted metal-dependent RNase